VPIVCATRSAVDQWRRLLDAGHASGILENEISKLMPAPGTPFGEAQQRVRAGTRGGLVFGGAWVARFDRLDRSPSGARRTTWLITHVEAAR
jgi:hypothetical protein